MKGPLVSIVIPTFNSEKTLARCLESILSQTYEDYEIIVVDGASTDKTVEIIKHYASKSFSIHWTSEKDKGIYDAMNKGIDLARGNWILFLGSDDEIYNKSVLFEVFQSPIPGGTLVIYGKALVLPEQFITSLNLTFDSIVHGNLCHQTMFYAKAVFDLWKYDLRFSVLSDWDLNLKLFGRYASRITCVDIIVCRYLNLGVSANWKTHPEYIEHFKNTRSLYFKYLPPRFLILSILRFLFRRLLRFRKQLFK
jgi:glycosyltransferase involved in cell wall biosynthesis